MSKRDPFSGVTIAELAARYFEGQQILETTATDNALDKALQAFQRKHGHNLAELDETIAKARPTTRTEALALLQVARHDFIVTHGNTSGELRDAHTDSGELMCFAAIDGALILLLRETAP